jgi:hypothetical protein
VFNYRRICRLVSAPVVGHLHCHWPFDPISNHHHHRLMYPMLSHRDHHRAVRVHSNANDAVPSTQSHWIYPPIIDDATHLKYHSDSIIRQRTTPTSHTFVNAVSRSQTSLHSMDTKSTIARRMVHHHHHQQQQQQQLPMVVRHQSIHCRHLVVVPLSNANTVSIRRRIRLSYRNIYAPFIQRYKDFSVNYVDIKDILCAE